MSLIVCRRIVDSGALIGTMNIRKKLGANVKRLREGMGLSQEQFAFEADIHRTYVSDVERGARNISIEVLEKFAKGLKVTPGFLLDAEPK